MMKTAIVWFKTDLRITDNETLVKAVEKNEYIIPVYCFDESHFKETKYGFKKTGSFRAQFLLEALEDLKNSLEALGSTLIILKGKPEIEIPKIVKEFSVKKVYAKKEIAFEEKKTEQKVQEEVFKLKCEFEAISTSTLYHAEDLPFSIKTIPDVFTDFRKKTEKESKIRPCIAQPTQIKTPFLVHTKIPTLPELGLEPKSFDSRSVLQFKGGEKEALHRLNHFFYETKALGTYKDTRNEMIGESYSSKFSPWLALGCISARTIYFEVKRYETQFGSNASTYWLIFELMWRDYFRFMFKKHQTKFFISSGIKENKKMNTNTNATLIADWINGNTPSDFINANMIELKLTGFMSNRGRQNVASYFCNELNLDWRIGAAYFEQQLIDYDASSNWGNWAYIAGVGNDPRGHRFFNIEKQANEYDKKMSYRKLWLK